MNGPLRVLFASTHTYLPQRAGGIESNTHDLCIELSGAGDEPAVLARLDPAGWLAFVNRLRRKLPFGPEFPTDRRMGYPVYRGWNPLEGAPEAVRRARPDVVVVQGTGPVPLTRAFLELDVPTVLYIHDVEFDRLGGEPPGDARLLVLANSEFTAARARRELRVEPHVVPPLVRPEAYRTNSSRDRVVFVNPHPLKGVEIAFGLAERRPDIEFLFVESWNLRPDRRAEYHARASALPNVEWSASVSDMREVYGQARVVLVPSMWEEAWGRVATESQISGIPVLASNRGGLPESVGKGGILVDPEAPLEAWEEALARMWDDPDAYEQLSEAALEHARRPAIQPPGLAARFRELISSHAAGAAPAADDPDGDSGS